MDKCECGCSSTVYGPLLRIDPGTKIWISASTYIVMGVFGLPAGGVIRLAITVSTTEIVVKHLSREDVIETLKSDLNYSLSGDGTLIYTGVGDPFNTGNDYINKVQENLNNLLNALPTNEELCSCDDSCDMEAPPKEYPIPPELNGAVDDQLKYIESILGPHPLPPPSSRPSPNYW